MATLLTVQIFFSKWNTHVAPKPAFFCFRLSIFFFLKNATSYIIFYNLFYWFNSQLSSEQCWSNWGADCDLPYREEKGMRNLLTPLYRPSALWVMALGQRNSISEECCSQGWESWLFSPLLRLLGSVLTYGTQSFQGRLEIHKMPVTFLQDHKQWAQKDKHESQKGTKL